MTYREFLALMAAYRIPSIDYAGGWLQHELDVLAGPLHGIEGTRSAEASAS
jgi:hypothetical protein